MLDMIEMSDLWQYQNNMPEGREKELLHKLLFEYGRYADCGTYEDCESRKEWFSYSLEHIMQNFNKTVKLLREEVAYIRQEADEKLKANGKDVIVGDTVYAIRCKINRGYGRKYDSLMTYSVKSIPRYLDGCYVAPKKCTKTDLNVLGQSVFKTVAEAQAYLDSFKIARAERQTLNGKQ